MTDDERKEAVRLRKKEQARGYRAKAKAEGRKTASETWWMNNREKHRANVAKWRAENPDKTKQIAREAQQRRISTAWGTINNRLVTCLHSGVRINSSRAGLYTVALGYRWSELRTHIENQFLPDMTWDNWGDLWELDHIEPLSSFKYVDLMDPLFKQAWRLENLRPLYKHLNQAKGSKREPIAAMETT